MRERAKLTQRELADVLGVERSTVAKWESGTAYPRASQLPALARALRKLTDTVDLLCD